MTNKQFCLLAGVMVIAGSFLAGVDHGLDVKHKVDKASQADRERIYCSSPGHSETLCKGK